MMAVVFTMHYTFPPIFIQTWCYLTFYILPTWFPLILTFFFFYCFSLYTALISSENEHLFINVLVVWISVSSGSLWPTWQNTWLGSLDLLYSLLLFLAPFKSSLFSGYWVNGPGSYTHVGKCCLQNPKMVTRHRAKIFFSFVVIEGERCNNLFSTLEELSWKKKVGKPLIRNYIKRQSLPCLFLCQPLPPLFFIFQRQA